jgi:hypothetical protein
VTQAVRYAIYFVPSRDGPIYRIGSSVLGWDCHDGKTVTRPTVPKIADAEWHASTEAASRYGLHATLKAPFRLADGSSEPSLIEAFKAFCAGRRAVGAVSLALDCLDGFLALTPRDPSPALDAFAFDCVQYFDRFRAPPDEEERQRRLAAPLSARQIANLENWGYPLVGDDFRFHITLTDRLDATTRERFAAALCGLIPAVDRVVIVDRVAVLKQPPGGRFHVIAEAALG